MDVYELIDSVAEQAELVVADLTEVKDLSALGLDQRAAYRVWVGDDVIAVPAGNDRTMQYYGGFEYIDDEHRFELGEFVFYLAEARRVKGALECLSGEYSDDEDE